MKILRKIKVFITFLLSILCKIFSIIPTKKNFVLFMSFHGRSYSDNPRSIFEYMQSNKEFEKYQYIWVLNNTNDFQIPNAKIVKYMSLSYFYYLSRCQYWIINCKMDTYIHKKKNQIYLQTWHGTPLKKLGHDIQVSSTNQFYRSGMSYEKMCQSYDKDVARYNYMISPNQFCTEIFPSAFGINKERLIETGYPRNDFITNVSKDDILNIKIRMNLPLNKKIILYAPTWRDNSYVASGYTFKLQADFQEWKRKLGNDYIILFKPHYLIINQLLDDHKLDNFLYFIDAHAEINELYVISDILITDYSSVFFDYAVLNRPIYFYMYDLEEYKEELRGFYLDIYTELPGKIYEEESNLLLDIKNHVYDYSFLKTFNQRFNAQQTGNCAQKVVDIVFKEKK